MLPLLIKARLTSLAMAGWTAAAAPVPMPMANVSMMYQARAATRVPVVLFDENLDVHATVEIDHLGDSDDATTQEIHHLFRCRVTNRERPIARRTLMMLADVAEMYEGRTIEFVSVVRQQRGESLTSPHRDGRAIDFRIRGVQLRTIRDYLWRKYTAVGIGWYPSEQFIHMDSRPTFNDTAWTFLKGVNHYHPYWSELARRPDRTPALPHHPGV